MKISFSYQGRIRKRLDHEFVTFAKNLGMIENDRFFDVRKGIRVMVFEATKKTLKLLGE